MLNAHMDTYSSINPERTIIKVESIWTRSSGILGADDRAGVTILLDLAERMAISNHFNGTIKHCFTVAEERGLVGAKKVAPSFLQHVDATIVFDRRNTHDIVISCNEIIPFYDAAYGVLFERAARQLGLNEWKCTAGGYSDTVIWVESGIQPVNLSVGYNNEHTSAELLNVIVTKQTSNLDYYLINNKLFANAVRTIVDKQRK